MAPLGHLGQADGTSLVGVEQPLVGAAGALHPGAEQLVGGALAVGSTLHGGEARELRDQPRRIGEQARDVVPDSGLDLLGFDIAARAPLGSGSQDAVLTVALVVAPLLLARRRPVGAPEHGQAAGPAVSRHRSR